MPTYFAAVLLEEIADDPDETAEHEPEETSRALAVDPERGEAEIADRERGHHAEFAEGEEGDEGKAGSFR